MPKNSIRDTFCGLKLPPATNKYFNWLNRLPNPLERLICLKQVNQIYAQAAAAPDQWQFLSSLLAALNVSYDLTTADLTRIPAQGPAVVVANHPFGGVEGIILPSLLGQVRQDVKILANYLLQPVTELQDLFIYVDPFGTSQSAAANLAGLREALAWLKQGGLLGIFPAGEVSHLTWRHREVTDPVWSRTVAGLIRKARADVVPVFLPATMAFSSNSWGWKKYHHPGQNRAVD